MPVPKLKALSATFLVPDSTDASYRCLHPDGLSREFSYHGF